LDLEEEIGVQLFLRVLFDEAVATCRRTGFSPKVRYEPDLITTVFVLVESRLGVSLVPSCVRGFAQQKTIRRPLAVQSDPMPLCVAWPRESQSPTLAALSGYSACPEADHSERDRPFLLDARL
jgi:DNA-binding transcriptional LysR family regulator